MVQPKYCHETILHLKDSIFHLIEVFHTTCRDQILKSPDKEHAPNLIETCKRKSFEVSAPPDCPFASQRVSSCSHGRMRASVRVKENPVSFLLKANFYGTIESLRNVVCFRGAPTSNLFWRCVCVSADDDIRW